MTPDIISHKVRKVTSTNRRAQLQRYTRFNHACSITFSIYSQWWTHSSTYSWFLFCSKCTRRTDDLTQTSGQLPCVRLRCKSTIDQASEQTYIVLCDSANGIGYTPSLKRGNGDCCGSSRHFAYAAARSVSINTRNLSAHACVSYPSQYTLSMIE